MYNNKNRQPYPPKPTAPHPNDHRDLALRAQCLEETLSFEIEKNKKLTVANQQLSQYKRSVSRSNSPLKQELSTSLETNAELEEKLSTLSKTTEDQAREIQQLKEQNEGLTRQLQEVTRQLQESSASLTLSQAVCATLRVQQQQYTSADQMSAEDFSFIHVESLLEDGSSKDPLQSSSLFQDPSVNNESSLQENHSGSNETFSEDAQHKSTRIERSSNVGLVLSRDHFLRPAEGKSYTNF